MCIQMAAGIVVGIARHRTTCLYASNKTQPRHIESLSCAFFQTKLTPCILRLFVWVFRWLHSRTQYVGFITISVTLIEFVYGFVLEKKNNNLSNLTVRKGNKNRFRRSKKIQMQLRFDEYEILTEKLNVNCWI